MLTEREQLILRLIYEKTSVSLEDLQQLFGVSARTINKDLSDINNFLTQHQQPELIKKVSTSYTSQVDKKILRKLAKGASASKNELTENYWDDPKFRVSYIYSQMFWDSQRMTIEYLMKLLTVSRSTVNSDIRHLKKKADKTHVQINFDKRQGFYLSGCERSLRNLYFDLSQYLQRYNYKPQNITNQNIHLLTKWLHQIEAVLQLSFTYESFQILVSQLIVIIERIREKKNIHLSSNITEKQLRELKIISPLIQPLESKLNIPHSTSEQLYILERMHQQKMTKRTVVEEGYDVELDMMVNKFLISMSNYLQIDFSNNSELFRHLALHFQTSLNHSMQHLENMITREILSDIQTKYHEVLLAVKTSIKDNLPLMVPFDNEQEYTFLTLYIISAIDKLKEQKEKGLNILVVCYLGIGTSQFIKYHLQNYTHAHINVIAANDINKRLQQTDLIISTTDLPSINKPVVKISPILNRFDLNAISDAKAKIIKAKIKSYYEKKKEWMASPMLKDLLTNKTVQTHVDVPDWQSAITHGGKILENLGTIEHSYTQSMIEAVKKYGPYIVIAPHIALAHATPGIGVNQIGMSFCVLEHGVNFGNKKNDPVNILVCLAATDHHTHLKALSELVTCLGDPKFLDIAMEYNQDQIIDYIEQIDNKEMEIRS